METFRPSSRPQPKLKGDHGRGIEIVDVPNYLNNANNYYLGRPSQPSFDDHPRSFDRKMQVEKKKRSKSSTSIKSWWNEPTTKRKRRLAKYKMFSIEGKLKSSLKKGQKWVKKKYSEIVHGY